MAFADSTHAQSNALVISTKQCISDKQHAKSCLISIGSMVSVDNSFAGKCFCACDLLSCMLTMSAAKSRSPGSLSSLSLSSCCSASLP